MRAGEWYHQNVGRWQVEIQVIILPDGRTLKTKMRQAWGNQMKLQKPSKARELGESQTSHGYKMPG